MFTYVQSMLGNQKIKSVNIKKRNKGRQEKHLPVCYWFGKQKIIYNQGKQWLTFFKVFNMTSIWPKKYIYRRFYIIANKTTLTTDQIVQRERLYDYMNYLWKLRYHSKTCVYETLLPKARLFGNWGHAHYNPKENIPFIIRFVHRQNLIHGVIGFLLLFLKMNLPQKMIDNVLFNLI